jgi:hypothetical protein
MHKVERFAMFFINPLCRANNHIAINAVRATLTTQGIKCRFNRETPKAGWDGHAV